MHASHSTLPSHGLTGQLPLDASIWSALPALSQLDLHNNTMNGYLPPSVRAPCSEARTACKPLAGLGQESNLNS